MSMFDKLVSLYAETLGVNGEDVRALFETCCEMSYNGNIERFMDDLSRGVVVTSEGPTSVRAYVDDQMESEMWG